MFGDFYIVGSDHLINAESSLNIKCSQYNHFIKMSCTEKLENTYDRNYVYCFPDIENTCLYDFSVTINGQEIKPQIRPLKEALQEFEEAMSQGYLAIIGNSTSLPNQNYFMLGNIKENSTIEVNYKLSSVALLLKSCYFFRLENSKNKAITIDYDMKCDSEIQEIKTKPAFEVSMIDKYNATFSFKTNGNLAVGVYTDLYHSFAISSAGNILISTYKNFKGVKTDPDDYYFLIDCSGSMNGSRIDKAKKCLQIFIQSLPEDCNFKIIRFGSQYKTVMPLCKYTNDNVQIANNLLQSIKADMGGTDIYLSLFHASISSKHKSIFLLTDGEVNNTEQIISPFKILKDNTKVYTIGVGDQSGKKLIVSLAETTSAKHTFVSDDDNMSAKVIMLLSDSVERPKFNTSSSSTMSIDCEGEISEIFPSPLPRLMSNVHQQIIIKAQHCDQILVNADNGDESIDICVPVMKVDDDIGLGEYLAKEQIDACSNADKCVQISISKGVLCKYTSFISVVPQSVINPIYKERLDEFRRDMRFCDTRSDEEPRDLVGDAFKALSRKMSSVKCTDPRTDVQRQNVDGSWDDFPQIDEELKEKYGQKVAATVAAIVFIKNKFKNGIEYSLIVKKGYSFLMKQNKEINWEEIVTKYLDEECLKIEEKN